MSMRSSLMKMLGIGAISMATNAAENQPGYKEAQMKNTIYAPSPKIPLTKKQLRARRKEKLAKQARKINW